MNGLYLTMTGPAIYSSGFEELTIEPTTVENFIGFIPDSAPDPFPEIISGILSQAVEKIKSIGGYVIFDNISIDKLNKKISINDVVFNTHLIVTRHLDRATSIAVFVCTAGNEVSKWAAEYNNKGNPIHAYIIDSLGSIAVERAMNVMQDKMKTQMQGMGLRITNRYSPGYCNWPTKDQKLLFGLLPDRFCGVTLTDSLLMKPIKSISGFIGIGKDVSYKKYTCNFCKDTHCLYRNKR
jgi:hypothetical protein